MNSTGILCACGLQYRKDLSGKIESQGQLDLLLAGAPVEQLSEIGRGIRGDGYFAAQLSLFSLDLAVP